MTTPSQLRQTHTVVVLGISQAAFDEISQKLRAAGYDHVFMPDGEVDMSGIAVAADASAGATVTAPASDVVPLDECCARCLRDGMVQRASECKAHGVTGAPAHSKSEYKRRTALGDPNVLPPDWHAEWGKPWTTLEALQYANMLLAQRGTSDSRIDAVLAGAHGVEAGEPSADEFMAWLDQLAQAIGPAMYVSTTQGPQPQIRLIATDKLMALYRRTRGVGIPQPGQEKNHG